MLDSRLYTYTSSTYYILVYVVCVHQTDAMPKLSVLLCVCARTTALYITRAARERETSCLSKHAPCSVVTTYQALLLLQSTLWYTCEL